MKTKDVTFSYKENSTTNNTNNKSSVITVIKFKLETIITKKQYIDEAFAGQFWFVTLPVALKF